MGLRDEAERLLKDEEQNPMLAQRDYNRLALAAVPAALGAWCNELGVNEVPDYSVTGAGPGDDVAGYFWYSIRIEFVVEDIPFKASVDFGDELEEGGIMDVRLNHDGPGGDGQIKTMRDLAEALPYLDRRQK